MEVEINTGDDTARVHISGWVDESGAESLNAHFEKLAASPLKEVVLDFKDVTRIGSAGIGQILLLYKKMAEGGGALRVENTNKSLYNLFIGLKLDTLFSITK